jgi:hypothetical protein
VRDEREERDEREKREDREEREDREDREDREEREESVGGSESELVSTDRFSSSSSSSGEKAGYQ